jgi:O-antigen ligase
MSANATGLDFVARTRVSSVFSMAGLVGVYFGCRVCLTFLFFQNDPQVGAVVSFILNLLFLVPVVFYAAGPGSTSFRDALHVWPFRFVLAFLGLSLASLFWSETQSISVALGYWMAMAADVVLVLLLLHAAPAGRALHSLMKGYVAGVCVLALVAWASPAMADLRLGDNEFLNPNAIGLECAFGVLFCQHLAVNGARWKWLGVALALTLVRSLSKTSIIAFVLVECFYLSRSKTILRGTKIAIAFAGLLVVAIFWGLFAAYYAVYTNASTQAETLTGRIGIWLTTFGMALDAPWLGHGLHSFRAIVPAFGAFEAWHAHNELLQQFFTYGIVGVALVIALYGSLFVQARRLDADPLGLLARALLLLVAIRGLTDTERFDLSFPLWAITAISISLAQARPQRQEASA